MATSWAVHPAVAGRLRDAGIGNPDAALQLLGAESVRRLPDRENLFLSFPGNPPLVLYGKRHEPPTVGALLSDLVRLRFPRSPARREWEATAAVRALGIATPEPLLFVEEQGIVPGRSLIATAALADAQPLDQVLPGADPRHRRSIARAAAGLVRRLHDADLVHRDLYLCHLYLDRGGALALIDLHRAEAGLRPRARWIVKDLAALHVSCPRGAVSHADQMRFFRAYLGARRLDRGGKRLARRILRKSARMAAHVPRTAR